MLTVYAVRRRSSTNSLKEHRRPSLMSVNNQIREAIMHRSTLAMRILLHHIVTTRDSSGRTVIIIHHHERKLSVPFIVVNTKSIRRVKSEPIHLPCDNENNYLRSNVKLSHMWRQHSVMPALPFYECEKRQSQKRSTCVVIERQIFNGVVDRVVQLRVVAGARSIRRVNIRVMRVTFIILFVHILCWMPFNLTLFWSVIHVQSFRDNHYVVSFLLQFATITAVINPFIYGHSMFIKTFQRLSTKWIAFLKVVYP